MKLLFCSECGDVFGLLVARRHCRCGRSSGRYLDDVMVEVAGPSKVLCLMDGNPVDAWVLPEPHERVIRRKGER